MARFSWRSGAALSAVLLVTAAIVVTFVLFASNRSGHGTDATTAKLIPADARVYGVINTDLSSRQWVSAFRLAERLGQQQPEKRLHDTASSGAQLKWERDVVPFLGGDAAMYLRSVTGVGGIPPLAIVVRCKDAGQALHVIERQSGGGFKTARHAGATYEFDADRAQYLARLGDHLVLASDEESFFAVLDVHAGKQKSLAGVGEFKRLSAKLGRSFLGFFYIDTQQIADDALQDNNSLEDTLSGVGADFALKPFGLAVSAKGNAVRVEALSTGKADSVSSLLRSHQSRFAKLVSSDTSVFFSTSGLTQTYDDAVRRNRQELDDTIAKQGQYRGLDDALRSLGQTLGLNSLQDLIKLFTGETAVAVRFPGAGFDTPEFLLLAEVQDEKQGRDVFAKVANASADNRPRSEKVGAVELTRFVSSGSELAYAVTDGYVVVGSAGDVRALLEKKGQALADLPGYRNTAGELAGGLGTFAYVDLASLLRRSVGQSGDLGRAEQALEGLIVNLVSDHGTLRLSGALSVGK